MIHSGHNEVGGVPVEVVRKSVRRISLRIEPDGTVRLTIPKWWATLRQGEAFLHQKWKWITKVRGEVLARPKAGRVPPTAAELDALERLLDELNDEWSFRLGQFNVQWEIRPVKSLWGSCRWGSRRITFNAELARAPRELVEYVVVHEYTHFDAHDHGPRFYALMDERLPGWKDLRKRLNRRDWDVPPVPEPPPAPPPEPPPQTARLFQPEFW